MPTIREIAQYIWSRAPAYGVNRATALGIARYEGLNANTISSPTFGNRDARGYSFGPFQLFSGSPDPSRIAPGGMASQFMARYGAAPSAANWRQQVDFSLEKMSKGGYGNWYAVRDQGGLGAITQKGQAYANNLGLENVSDTSPRAVTKPDMGFEGSLEYGPQDIGKYDFGGGDYSLNGIYGDNPVQSPAGPLQSSLDSSFSNPSTQYRLPDAFGGSEQGIYGSIEPGAKQLSPDIDIAASPTGQPGAGDVSVTEWSDPKQQYRMPQEFGGSEKQAKGDEANVSGMWEATGAQAVSKAGSVVSKSTAEAANALAESIKNAVKEATQTAEKVSSLAAKTQTQNVQDATKSTTGWLDSILSNVKDLFVRGGLLLFGLVLIAGGVMYFSGKKDGAS